MLEALGRHFDTEATNLEEVIDTKMYGTVSKSNDKYISRDVRAFARRLEDGIYRASRIEHIIAEPCVSLIRGRRTSTNVLCSSQRKRAQFG